MQDVLKITLNATKGELVRVLALIERRQFFIRDLHTETGCEPNTTNLRVTVTSAERNVSSLAGQIQNLVDVRDVEVETGESQ